MRVGEARRAPRPRPARARRPGSTTSDVLAGRRREPAVDVRREAERPRVLEHARSRRKRPDAAREVRDHDELVDLRRERGQRLARARARGRARRRRRRPSSRAPPGRPRASARAVARQLNAARALEPGGGEPLALGERAAHAVGEVRLRRRRRPRRRRPRAAPARRRRRPACRTPSPRAPAGRSPRSATGARGTPRRGRARRAPPGRRSRAGRRRARAARAASASSFSGPTTTSGSPTACGGRERRERVLPRLDRADEEHVRRRAQRCSRA